MKVVIALFALVAIAVAAPANSDVEAEIVDQELDNIGVGPFNWSFKTSNNIGHEQKGELINEGKENEAVVVSGKFQYYGNDKVFYTVTYVADENGYQPVLSYKDIDLNQH